MCLLQVAQKERTHAESRVASIVEGIMLMVQVKSGRRDKVVGWEAREDQDEDDAASCQHPCERRWVTAERHVVRCDDSQRYTEGIVEDLVHLS